jgi:outer membrane receptor protein involved in Fe transport
VNLTALCFITLVLFINTVPAQSPNGTVSGIVLDPSGGVIIGADVLIINDATGVQYPGKANSEGYYVVPNLPPGTYRIQVSNSGFKTIIKPDIVIHVLDALAINFTLPIGAASEVVTVQGGAPLINTENAAVSTVIDRQFVENLPLNGRSFNTLLQLTPGVIIAPIVGPSSGQFSIAGQRASSNNFLVDGVSANFGVAPGQNQGAAGTGSAQAFSALGGTSSLVSVEALQEFRVETSSFAPEFGRSTGGQVILNTRSGTNSFHGGVYEYFRNDVMDANNWFNNWAIPAIAKAPERHNDFGGFLGGPIQNDRTFFFVSYEGARLRQPNTELIQVPSEYARTTAPTDLAPFLNAYPLPDDKTITPDIYKANFTGSYSNPGTLDAGSVRVDHTFNSRFSIFGRYNEAPSETAQRRGSLSDLQASEVNTRTITLGGNIMFGARSSDSFRANYSVQNGIFVDSLDSFGGAIPPSLSVLAPNLANPESADLAFFLFDTSNYITGPNARNRTRQLNFADDFTVTRGTHQLKFGADYRAIYLDFRPAQTSLIYYGLTTASFISTSAVYALLGGSANPTDLLAQSTSLYAQDTWKATSRFTLTYGLRWELAPAPSPRNGSKLAAWENVDNPAALALAPFGTPVWTTAYTNFAPRVGAAYSLTEKGDFVLRGGWGMFYDLASDTVPQMGEGFTALASEYSYSVSVPVGNASTFIPAISLQPPYPNMTVGFAPDLKLPRSYQWNVALEKSFGGQQAVSLTYVGQAGRNLLRQKAIDLPNSNFSGDFLLTENDARSNYNALQLQYRKPLASHLQALLNYTWSHSLDSASNDVIAALSGATISSANDYAPSDFDVRHSFSGALVFAIPGAKNGILGHLSRDWSIDTVIVARSGFRYNANFYTTDPFGGPGPRPDLNPGQPFYLYGAQCATTFQALGALLPGQGCPGGKGLNPNVFNTTPPSGRQGTEGRNDIPGFGLTQVDLSLGRKFQITEQLSLQFRADAFNLFNHPNFLNPIPAPDEGPASYLSFATLNQGLGGLNSLFQEGGPRSLQLSLKLTF